MGPWLLVVYVFMGAHPLVGKYPGFDTFGDCWKAGTALDVVSHDKHPGFTVAKMCINTNQGNEPNYRWIPASVLSSPKISSELDSHC
jgi:hypothetical protein